VEAKKKTFGFLAGFVVLILTTGLAHTVRSANGQGGLQEPIRVAGGAITGTPAWGWGVRLYRGIPFAAPPVGNLRWREPQPAVPWQGVVAADHFGARCMQPQRGGAESPAGPGTNGGLWDEPGTNVISEDCLFLNVWTPARSATDKLAVIVFFHGGGGTSGEGSEAIFDGSTMAQKGVIWVTANYRLGAFGNLSLPELTAESEHHSSGNYAELDKLAALHWVKNNIAQFGGDPNNVTLMGHSSASRSVHNIVASPLAKGLFQRVISHSHTSFGRMITLGEAEAEGVKFEQAVGSKSLADLRMMSAKDLQTASARQGREFVYGDAKIDGWFLPADVNTIFNEGKQNDVSLLTGATNDEHGIGENLNEWVAYLKLPDAPPITPDDYAAWAKKSFGDQSDRLLKAYPAHSNAEVAKAVHDIGRDAILQGQRVWAQFQSKDGKGQAYLYDFSHKPPVPSTPGTQLPIIGAIHGAEFFYTLNNLHVRDLPWTDTDQKVADIASSYWTNFAKTGDPNGPGLPHWPAYSANDDQLMNVGDVPHAESSPNKAGLDFLAWWDQHFRIQATSSNRTQATSGN
jgi:para-nitrobenzyl esterase